MTTLTLAARPPFNFLSVVDSHGWRQLAPFSYDEAGQALGYAFRLSNGRVLELRIQPSEDGLRVKTAKLERGEQNEVREAVTWMFGLDQDFSAFYAATRHEPKLARAQELALGRVLRSPTLFEDVIKTILTTNTLWATTKNMTRKLVEAFGIATHPDAAAEAAQAFPTPDAIAASSPAYLREHIRVGYRAEAIHDLAVRVASGQFDLEALKQTSLPTLGLRKELLGLKGVGPYAAANLLMLLGRHDFIPIDSWALMRVSHEWPSRRPVTIKDVEKRFERWGEHRGLAYWFWDWKYDG